MTADILSALSLLQTRNLAALLSAYSFAHLPLLGLGQHCMTVDGEGVRGSRAGSATAAGAPRTQGPRLRRGASC